jgi:hypothetical protein
MGGMAFFYEKISPKAISTASLRGRLLVGSNNLIDKMRQDLSNTVEHWRHMDGGDFKFTYKYKGGDYIIEVLAQDYIFALVDEGTSYRRAKMHPKFVPKSTFRTLQSQPGAYPDPVERGSHLRLPGIKGRYFMRELKDKYDPLIWEMLEDALGTVIFER